MSTIERDKVVVSHEFGGATFNDSVAVAVNWPGAFEVNIDDLKGWRSTTGVTVIRTPRGTGDGDYIADRFPKKSRMIEVEGYITAPTRAQLDDLFDSVVVQAFPNDVDITITRYEPTPKYVVCRLAGEIEDLGYLVDAHGVDMMRWGATLLCADPLKYDAVNTLAGSSGVAGVATGGRSYPRTYPLHYNVSSSGGGNQVSLFNEGTTDAPALLDIWGPLPLGWRVELSNTGDFISFNTALSTSSDHLIIDTAAKSALLNGSSVNGLLGGTWWKLRPKANVIRLYGNYDPAAGFTVTAKSAWR